ncbi:hypothetical protein HYW74_00125 [Candidatus Pacearchaeota archaeon]|nr:hypothetical protein [Candidatus Pacearchaeota archaeon]
MDWDYLDILGRKVNAELCENDLLAVKGILDEAKREIFKDISKLAGKEGRKKLTVDYEGLYSMDRNFIRSSKSLVFRVGLIPNLSSKERSNIENYANDCPFNVEVYDLEHARESRANVPKKQNKRSVLGRYKVKEYA